MWFWSDQTPNSNSNSSSNSSRRWRIGGRFFPFSGGAAEPKYEGQNSGEGFDEQQEQPDEEQPDDNPEQGDN